MKISFIFCIYNEYKNLLSNLKKTEDYISNQIDDYEIMIIDNNSSDGSAEFIRNYVSKKIKKYFNNIVFIDCNHVNNFQANWKNDKILLMVRNNKN